RSNVASVPAGEASSLATGYIEPRQLTALRTPHQRLTIRRVGRALNGGDICKAAQLRAGLDVPDSHDAIVASRNHAAAVGRKNNAANLPAVACESDEQTARGNFPELGDIGVVGHRNPAPAAGSNNPAIRRKCQ